MQSLISQLNTVQSQMTSLANANPGDTCVDDLIPLVNTLVADADDNTGILSLLGCAPVNNM